MDKRPLKRITLLLLASALLSPVASTPAMAGRMLQISGEIGVIGGSVSRSAFTEAVVNREPKSRLSELPNTQQHIYYFSELKGMAGQNITHRWLFNGKVMTESKFNVGSPRWRIWSGATLRSDQIGTWEVQVVNELDQVVYSDSFDYVQAASR